MFSFLQYDVGFDPNKDYYVNACTFILNIHFFIIIWSYFDISSSSRKYSPCATYYHTTSRRTHNYAVTHCLSINWVIAEITLFIKLRSASSGDGGLVVRRGPRDREVPGSIPARMFLGMELIPYVSHLTQV